MAYPAKPYLCLLLYLSFPYNIYTIHGGYFALGTNAARMPLGSNGTITGERETSYIYEPEPKEASTTPEDNEASYVYDTKPGNVTVPTGENIVIEGLSLPISELYTFDIEEDKYILNEKIAVSEDGRIFIILDEQTALTYLYDEQGKQTGTEVYLKGRLAGKTLVTGKTFNIEGEYLPISEVYEIIDGQEVLVDRTAASEDGRTFIILDEQTALTYLYDEQGKQTGTEVYLKGRLAGKTLVTGETFNIEGEYLPISEAYEIIDGQEILIERIAVSEDGRTFFILDEQTAIAYLYDEQGNLTGTEVYYEGRLVEKSITTGETIIIEGQSVLIFETYEIINGEEIFAFKRASLNDGRVFQFTDENALVELIYDEEGNILETIPFEI